MAKITKYTAAQDIHLGISSPEPPEPLWLGPQAKDPPLLVSGSVLHIKTLPIGTIFQRSPEQDAPQYSLDKPLRVFVSELAFGKTKVMPIGKSFIIRKGQPVIFEGNRLIDPPPPKHSSLPEGWPGTTSYSLLKSGLLLKEDGTLLPRVCDPSALSPTWATDAYPISLKDDQDLTTASPEPTDAPHRNPAPVDDPSFNDRLSDL